jgi:hypothetical protein
VIEIRPSSSSVVAALRDLGRWKAGTPLEIASTPVSAAHPEENARASRVSSPIVVNGSSQPGSGWTVRSALSTSGRSPMASRIRPTAAMPRTATMNRYVGTANRPPDSRMPRRLMAISSTTSAHATTGSCPLSAGNAEAAYCAPEEIETATVST